MKHIQYRALAALVLALFSLSSTAQQLPTHYGHSGHDHKRPDSHAPIGIMGDHLMRSGESMITYRFMHMSMEDNLVNKDRIATPLPGYMVSPLAMDTDMHMLGYMYAPTDRLTMMLMLPLTSISMDHVRHAGNLNFTTESSGIGDIKLSSTYGLANAPGIDLLFNFAVSLPTGSIDERDTIPTMPTPSHAHLPYPMQLGSGTLDLIAGITYVQVFNDSSWGAQVLYTYRTGTNDNNYTLGNKLDTTGWIAKKLNASTSVSFRINLSDWKNIDGADNKLMAMPSVPTKDPELRAGSRVDALVGVNYVPAGLNSLRLAFEAGTPVYQKLDGPQLETDLMFTLGAQYTF